VGWCVVLSVICIVVMIVFVILWLLWWWVCGYSGVGCLLIWVVWLVLCYMVLLWFVVGVLVMVVC